MRAYPPPKFRVSSISGSRVSRGGRICPPSRAGNSQTLSRGRVNQVTRITKRINHISSSSKLSILLYDDGLNKKEGIRVSE